MQNLEDFVRSYIRTKDLSVGYASALEVARKPEGDCTQHAVLLAALGRAVGIPTRVVDGIVYVDSYAGSEHVFVPHAWTQAYVDGSWHSFDAALHGFDAGHVALSVATAIPGVSLPASMRSGACASTPSLRCPDRLLRAAGGGRSRRPWFSHSRLDCLFRAIEETIMNARSEKSTVTSIDPAGPDAADEARDAGAQARPANDEKLPTWSGGCTRPPTP